MVPEGEPARRHELPQVAVRTATASFHLPTRLRYGSALKCRQALPALRAPPASGAILIFWLHVLKYYNFVPEDECDPLTYHRLVEALKWAYAERTHMGDPYDPEITDFIESV